MRGASVVLILVAGTVAAIAQDQAVPVSTIPKPVMSALVSRFPNARVDKCSKAREGADVVYDIEFTQESRKWEADVTERGVLTNYEKAISAKDLPKAVGDAVAKRYPGAALRDVMAETAVSGKDERLSAYEIVLVTRTKKAIEVRLSPAGKFLDHE